MEGRRASYGTSSAVDIGVPYARNCAVQSAKYQVRRVIGEGQHEPKKFHHHQPFSPHTTFPPTRRQSWPIALLEPRMPTLIQVWLTVHPSAEASRKSKRPKKRKQRRRRRPRGKKLQIFNEWSSWRVQRNGKHGIWSERQITLLTRCPSPERSEQESLKRSTKVLLSSSSWQTSY
jgi:hypothetical protein